MYMYNWKKLNLCKWNFELVWKNSKILRVQGDLEEYVALFCICSLHLKKKKLYPLELEHRDLRCLKFFLMCSSNRVIRTSLQLQLRWLIRNHILLWKSFLTLNTSSSIFTNLASELFIKISDKLPSVNMFERRQWHLTIYTIKSVILTPKMIFCSFYFNSKGLIRTKTFSWYTRWRIFPFSV